MIIRRRSLRVLSKHRPMGQIGTRTLRRSLTQARRMLVSRQPEQAPPDLQEAIAQPLIWGIPQNLQLPPATPTTAPIIESFSAPTARRGSTAPASSASMPVVQREPQADTEEDRTMPRDLQRIFDMHKGMGHVNDNVSVVDLIKKDKGGGTKSRGNASVQRKPVNPTPLQPTPNPPPIPSRPSWLQREPEAPAPDTTAISNEDDLPIVVEPQPRRVRSRVEYVNRPDPDAGAQASAEVTPSSDVNASIARQPDEILDVAFDGAFDEPFVDFGEDAPATDDYDDADDAPRVSPPTGQPLQRNVDTIENAVAHAERPSVQRSPESDIPTIIHTGEIMDEDSASGNTPTATPIQRNLDSSTIQRAVEQAERPSGLPTTPSANDPISGVERLSELRENTDLPLNPTATVNTPSANVPLQRTTDGSPSSPSSPSSQPQTTASIPSQRVSTQAQAIQRAIEAAERPSSDQITAASFEPSAPQSSQRSTDTPAVIYDDGAYGFDDIQRLPEQPIDLGAALFGDLSKRPNKSLLEPDGPDAPTPVLMPPIGKTRPRTSSTSTPHTNAMQRAIERAEAPSNDPRSTQERAWEASESLSDPLLSPDFPTLIDTSRAPMQRQPLRDVSDTTVEASPYQDQAAPAVSANEVQRAVDDAIRRAESSPASASASSPSASTPTSQEAHLLTLLNMPADTPIQRGGVPMPGVQASFEDSTDLQRAITIDEVSSEVGGGEGGEQSETELNDMAQKVYGIIKRRLRNEQERLKGKK